MSLTPGTKVGAYEIVGLLGAGGMGQVYRAHDAKLGRDVAIKILPDQFVADAERLARFEREARTLASLNHPNIAQIYGFEEYAGSQDPALRSDGAPGPQPRGAALVMELVEGEDLSLVIARGKVPLSDALPIARQIAQALEAAHEAGVVHRDLKPANIKLRADGTVKVLDFGLAKAMDPSGGASGSLANSPTITNPATELGTILGTAAYMSPEQARGKVVDRRADVWAFGVVFYEMLSGRRAFDGSEVSDVLASVLKDTIAFDALPADTPSAIRRLLRRCLTKDRTERLDSMATARLEIAEALSPNAEGADGRGKASDTSQRPAPRQANLGYALVAVVVAFAIFAVWALFRPLPPAPGRVVRFSVASPPGLQPTAVAVTSTGDTIIYEADRIYVRGLGDAEPRAVPGTEGARMAFVSPDDKWVGFYAAGKIKKVSLSGGDPLSITDADLDSPGAAWGRGDTVFFSSGWNAPLHAASTESEGKSVAVSTLDTAAGELGHWWPEPLPDGKSVLFTVWMAAAGINDSKIAVLDLATGKHRILMPGSNPKYLSTGQLLFFHAGEFHIVAFDPVALRATGDSRKVLPGARPLDPTGSRVKSIAVSSAGTLVYLSGALELEKELAWATAAGTVEPISGAPQRWFGISLSPDGRWIAGARSEGGTRGLWLHDLVRQTDKKIDAPGANFDPVWSPTGDFLVFSSLRKGHFDAYMLRPDEGVVRPLIEEPYDQGPVAVTQDGKRMVLYDYFSNGAGMLTVADIEKPTPRTKIAAIQPSATQSLRVSPDDHWVAAGVTTSGRKEIVVLPFPAGGATVPVSSRGGITPLWSNTGSKLYYQRDDELVAATYSVTGGRFAIEREDVLFRLHGYDLVGLAPDGRFLLAKDTPGQETKIQVIVNWFAEIAK